MTIQKRVAEVILYFEKNNKTAFSQKTGIPKGTISSIIGEGNSVPSFETLLKIVQTYPTLSLEWLIKGEGEIEEGKTGGPPTFREEVLKIIRQELDNFKRNYERDQQKIKDMLGFKGNKPDDGKEDE